MDYSFWKSKILKRIPWKFKVDYTYTYLYSVNLKIDFIHRVYVFESWFKIMLRVYHDPYQLADLVQYEAATNS